MLFNDFDHYRQASLQVLQQMEDPALISQIEQVAEVTLAALADGLPLLVCGNGGSAADAQHIVTELVGRFMLERRAINAICLSSNVPLLSAISNDSDFTQVFSRQIEALVPLSKDHQAECLGCTGVLWLLSTSGESANMLAAAQTARQQRITVVAFTGSKGGALLPLTDYGIRIPAVAVPLVQQVHQCVYHYLCGRIEQALCANKQEKP